MVPFRKTKPQNIRESDPNLCFNFLSLLHCKNRKKKTYGKKTVQQIVKCATYEDKQLFNLLY